jgi:hypothetical protein
MTCDDALNLLCARIDGELSSEDRARLDAHLCDCHACRATAEAFALQDADLRRASHADRLAADALADRVIAQLPRPRTLRLPWLTGILSAAAGFALAFALFHRATTPSGGTPIAHPASQPTSAPVVAQLALATGAVQFRCPGDADWCPMPTGGAVPAGASVRTGPDVRCELRTADGSEVRLNAATEIQLQSPRRFSLAVGQVWSSVAKAPDAFEAKAADATFTALGTQFDLACAEPKQALCTVVEGKVRVTCPGGDATLAAGHQLTVAAGRLGDQQAVHNLALATRWVNEILVMKGRDNPELARRIDDLMANIGQQKMSFMFEEEIRALGDHCVIPLTKYIESPRSAGDPARRATAARIVADVAPPWAIPQLIELLGDKQGEVRADAATALQRLTGESMGLDVTQWRTQDAMTCQPTVNRWQQWWQHNRERYPGVPPTEQPVVDKPAPLPKG